jgi:hypothetical protein
MAMPHERPGRPARDRAADGVDADQGTNPSLILSDEARPLVDLAVELRGDIPRPVLTTLVVEALDLSADLLLCEAWAETRQRLYPDAIRCAHNRHSASYAERRAVELAAVRRAS